MTFRVKFIDMREQTVNTTEYSHLMDALKVSKETNIGPDRVHRVAISEDKFDTELITLLTSCFIYAGSKSVEYPDGDVMIQLFRVDKSGIEGPVYTAVSPPRLKDDDTHEMNVFGSPEIPAPKTNYIHEPYTMIKFVGEGPKSEPGAGNYS